MRRKRQIPPEQIRAEIEELKVQIKTVYAQDRQNDVFFLSNTEVISHAVLNVSRVRAQERIERLRKLGAFGWICGTHTRSLRQLIAESLKIKCTSEQIDQIIMYCNSGTCDGISAECVENHLAGIWELIPNLHINITYPDYDDPSCP